MEKKKLQEKWGSQRQNIITEIQNTQWENQQMDINE